MINTDLENASKIMIGLLEAEAIYVGSNLIWNSVPYDAEIEYLESTGTLYIDLNFYPNSTTHVIIDAQLNDIDNYHDGAGTMGPSGSNRFLICNVYQGSFHFGCGYQWSNVMQADINRHIFLLWGDGNCAIDNRNYLINENCNFSLSVDSFYLFAKNRESNDIDYGAIKIYSCKIYNNDTLVKDIIPVRVGQVGYIYDKISKQLFGNQGTESFTLGPDKLPSEYTELEYLESSGTQWIDTLIHPVTGYGFELYGGFTVFNNNEFFGGGNNYDNGLGICTHGAGTYGIIVGTTEVCNISAANNVMHLFRVNTDGTVYIDNEYKGQSNTEMPEGTYTMNIFRHSATKVTQSEKIYYCKIFNNESLVFDGIPVRKDGIGYMFDRVSKTLFANQGTGDFILGPDKS